MAGDDVPKKKPDPSIYKIAAERLQANNLLSVRHSRDVDMAVRDECMLHEPMESAAWRNKSH